jgi:CAP-Gly domain-containing linker protein 1
VERLKEKLIRSNKKQSKTSTEVSDTRSRVSLDSSTISSDHSVKGPSVDVCEICEQPGHDIFNCDLLNGGTTTTTTTTNERTRTKGHNETKDLFCEDCEGHGHVAADCPHSMDVF